MAKYFEESEFACKCGCGFCKPHIALMEMLDRIRGAAGRPIGVTSGCRCEEHNRHVDGVVGSNHTKGLAADIQCRGVSASALWRLVRELYKAKKLPELAGLGRYDTFVHVDIAPKKDRLREWDERKVR